MTDLTKHDRTFTSGATDVLTGWARMVATARELGLEVKLSKHERDKVIKALAADGLSQRAIAKETGVSHMTVSRTLKPENVPSVTPSQAQNEGIPVEHVTRPTGNRDEAMALIADLVAIINDLGSGRSSDRGEAMRKAVKKADQLKALWP